MTIIPADIPINLAVARLCIERDFPHLRIENMHPIGEGFDNLVFLVNGEYVFRFPRRSVAAPLLEAEIIVLQNLPGTLPLSVPRPELIGTKNEIYPWPYYGHKIIPGRTGCNVSLDFSQYQSAARALGRSLKILHNIEPSSLDARIVTPQFDRINFSRMRTFLMQRLPPITLKVGQEIMTPLLDSILNAASHYESTKLALVHGDLYHRHLIFNPNSELSGIIDWGDAGISDPIVDLSVVFQFFPKEHHDAFFAEYGHVSDSAKAYARFLGFYYAVTLYWFGENRGDLALTETSLKTIDFLCRG